MRTLITGAQGYIGRTLVGVMNDEEISFPTRDEIKLDDYSQVEKYLKDNEIRKVIHLAACVKNGENSELFSTNIHGLYILLSACISCNISHFVFASTNNVYGTNHQDVIEETSDCHPDFNNAYALSKYVGELLVTDLLKNSGVLYAIARISDVYGHEQKHGNLLKEIVRKAKNKENQVLYGSGNRMRDYINVNDVALALAYLSKKSSTGVYNISTGKGLSVKTIIEYIATVQNTGIERISVDREDISKIVLDNKKLKSLGFDPTIELFDWLKKEISEEKGDDR